MSIASDQLLRNTAAKVAELEARISALESRPVNAETPDWQKIKNDIQGLKMRMGKVAS